MDPLTFIVAAMTAILFSWIGYALGNFFPVSAKAKKAKEKRTRMRELEGRDTPVKGAGKRFIDWLLEREEEEEEDFIDHPDTVPLPQDTDPKAAKEEVQEDVGENAESLPAAPATQPSQYASGVKTVLVDTPDMAGDNPVVLWHNKKTKKLFAKLENDIIDLDSDLSPSHHGDLSMLLVDLQERVGIPATLRDAIAEGTDKVMAEKERQPHITPEEEPLERPSFNPIKSFVNYVRSDIPKIDQSVSIPQQIDNILQANLAGTEFEDKGISVRQWPNRGVVFIVGLDVYEDLHKVPDPEIRDHIRQAVKQWEASQEKEE